MRANTDSKSKLLSPAPTERRTRELVRSEGPTAPASVAVHAALQRGANCVRTTKSRANHPAAVFKKTPYIADLQPAGRDVAKDIYDFGSIPLLITTQLDHGFQNGDRLTFSGRTIVADLQSEPEALHQSVVRQTQRPAPGTGGVRSKGSFTPEGVAVKVMGMSYLKSSEPVRQCGGESVIGTTAKAPAVVLRSNSPSGAAAAACFDVNVTDHDLATRPSEPTFGATDHLSTRFEMMPDGSGPQSAALRPVRAGRPRSVAMRMFERTVVFAWVVGATALTPAFAFEGTPVSPENTTIPVASSQPGTAPALKKAIPVDTTTTSLTALQYAAEGGHPIAQWRLGRMYADGNGVAQDDLRAFDYFSKIANAHAEDSPSAPQAAVVANAFVALGRYYLDGIPNSKIKRDPERAREMFSYAASYFGNADAQYDLARLYIEGIGMPRDFRYGARWLGLAAQKGQHQAQAMLGQLLFNGEKLPKQAARGLMWLTLARDSAAPEETWIKDSYNRAFAKASDDDRAMALQMLEHWVQGRRD